MKRTLLPIGLTIGVAGAGAVALFLLWPDTARLPADTPQAIQTEQTQPPQVTAASGSIMQAQQHTVRIGKHTLNLLGDTLLPTPTLVGLFNDWLSSTQSQRYEEWKPAALKEADRLPSAAREQLSRWLDQYVELNLALQLLAIQGEPSWDNILENVRTARSAYFSDADAALFTDQIALENFTQSAVMTLGDSSDPLTTLAELRQSANTLPDIERGKVEKMLAQLSQRLEQNPTLTENAQAWNSLVQAQVAGTLETASVDLAESNADFLKRYNTYADTRNGLLQQGATEEQLRALRETHFTGAELLRAGTFDKALAE